MRTRAALILTAVVVAIQALAGGSAGASGAGEANGTTEKQGGKVVVAVPGAAGSGFVGSGFRPSSGSSNIACSYFEASVNAGAEMPGVGPRVVDTSTLEAGAGVWLGCRDVTSGNLTYQSFMQWDPASSVPLAPPAALLAQMAANTMTLPFPSVRTWPPSGSTALVNLPVWLHVDNWEPVSASASAGGLTATVEAVPVRAEWDMDDGSVTCTDAGTPFDPSLRPDPGSSSCSFTYVRSSGGRPDRTFRNSAVVVWRLRWYATNGQGGDLGELDGPVAAFGL